MKKHLHLPIFVFFLLIISNSLSAQSTRLNMLEQIIKYKSVEKEKTYLHLNRSLLLKGDQLAFTAYIINEIDHTPVSSNSNLYLTITNANKEVISQSMYPVESGIASGVIEIDSTYSAGQYTLTAYSKYMKEFEEPYHFTENFQVMDTGSPEQLARAVPDKIDVQFLPESGQFLSGAINNVGVIAKNALGYGVSHGKILIKKVNGDLIHVINLNEFGIGKFAFLPVTGERYIADLEYEYKSIRVDFKPEVQREGVIFSTSEKDSELEIMVKTNDHTLRSVSPELSLIIQGKKKLLNFDIAFTGHKNMAVRVPMKDLDPGINIITLFNGRNQPMAERLVFNFEGFDPISPQKIQSRVMRDSLQIRIPFQQNVEGSLSISVLPQKTISYNRNHSIISHFHLQPYLRGNIENGGWYFIEQSAMKKEELDKLLITQGWSSYEWKRVFNRETGKIVKEVDNFSFTARIPAKDRGRKDLRYMLHGSGNNGPQVIEIPLGADSFVFEGFVPVKGDNLNISRIEPNNLLVPANLSILFEPNRFTDAPTTQNPIPYLVKAEKKDLTESIYNYELLNKDTEILDEVKLFGKTAQSPKERERSLGNIVMEKAHVITLDDVKSYLTLADYLGGKNLNVTNSLDGIQASSNIVSSTNIKMGAGEGVETIKYSSPTVSEGGMLFYLDDSPMPNSSMFYSYPLAYVDYILINKTGLGEGFLGSKGTIKIYTKQGSHFPNRDRNRIQEVKIPLTYAANKKFYVPKYVSTSNSFFEEFGVIDWKPEVQFNNSKIASITIKDPEVDFQLIIEGVTSDGDLIHSVQELFAGSN